MMFNHMGFVKLSMTMIMSLLTIFKVGWIKDPFKIAY